MQSIREMFQCCGTGGAKQHLAREATAAAEADQYRTTYQQVREVEARPVLQSPPMGYEARMDPRHMHADEKAAKHEPARCTDAFCAIIWLACIVGCGFILKTAEKTADVRELFHGIDWDGNVCGLGDMENKSYLYWCPQGGHVLTDDEFTAAGIDMDDLHGDVAATATTTQASTTTQVAATTDAPAVTDAPTVTDAGTQTDAPAATSASTAAPQADLTQAPTPAPQGADDASHVAPNRRESIAGFGTRRLAETPEVFSSAGHLQLAYPICVSACPRGGNTVHKCLNNTDLSTEVVNVQTGSFYEQKDFNFRLVQDVETYSMGHMFCLPEDHDLTEELQGKFSWGLQAFLFHLAQAEKARYNVLAAVGVAMVLGYIYLFLAKCCARVLVYLSIFAGVIFPIAAGAYLIFEDEVASEAKGRYNQTLQTFTTGDENKDMGIAAGLCLLGIIVGAVACCMHKHIEMVLSVIRVTMECLFDTPAMLFHPLYIVFPRVLSVIGAFCGFAYLLTIGEVKHPETQHIATRGIGRAFHFTDLQKLQIGFFCVVSIWTIEVLKAMDEFVFAYVANLWYWKPVKQKEMKFNVMCRGYKRAWIHMGSLAYGSFIILLFRPITYVMSFMYSRVTGSAEHGNCVQKCMSAGYCCCFQCWEKFIRFLTRDAYLMVAVKSVGFIEGAGQAIQVLEHESSAAKGVYGARRLFQAGGLIAITSSSCYATWLLCLHTSHKNPKDPKPDDYVSNAVFVTILSGIVAFMVAMIFTMIFDIVANTLLFSWASDESRGVFHREHGLPRDFEDTLGEASIEDNSNRPSSPQYIESNSFGFDQTQHYSSGSLPAAPRAVRGW